MMKKLTFLLLLLLSCSIFTVRADEPVGMADALRSSGKIYVVIAIICIIFAGLALYLFAIDRRLKRIEKGN